MASCSSFTYSSVAENNARTLKVCLQQRSSKVTNVKLHVKSYATKIPRESTPYITLTLHFSRHLPAAILRVGSQADRLRSACLLAIIN